MDPPPAPMTLEQLQALVQTLQGTITQLQTQLATQQAAAPIFQGGATFGEKHVKMSKPDPFSGKADDTERFIHQCELYFGTGSFDDKEKILFALSYMKEGKALTASQVFHDAWQQRDYDGTWDEFKQDQIRLMFGDSARAETARLRIQAVNQGKGTADEYIVSFQEHELLTGYDDIALVEAFKRGLNEPLRKNIYTFKELPKTLLEWKNAARILDRQYRESLMYRNLTPRTPANTRAVRNVTGTPSSSSPSPAASSSRTTYSPVKVEPKSEASLAVKRTGNCHICGSPEHWANKCPQKKGKGKGRNIRVVTEDDKEDPPASDNAPTGF